jgi:hypothetical protein
LGRHERLQTARSNEIAARITTTLCVQKPLVHDYPLENHLRRFCASAGVGLVSAENRTEL